MNAMGKSQPEIEFDSLRAYQDIEYQVALGPRIPGTEAHQKIQEWMLQKLQLNGWETEVQNTTIEDQPVSNIIGKFGQGKPWIILGAHYDTRIYADLDPDLSKTLEPVPGANDGGSGVAVLLELARQLPAHFQGADGSNPDLQGTIWLVFFDAEDNGRIEGWDWILGSRAFVAELQSYPDAAVIVDMVGDKNLKIYQEENSDDRLTREIWDSAEGIGYEDYFLPYEKYAVLDDHVPFLEAGIPAADIIDFEYAYWHTTSDTPDNVSAESLEIVGKTLLAWLISQY
ncbi:MAG: hypothetical protein A2Z16_09555 [Chloroflexi bacterium RBG_16_54_18]|nr:MAG: hypothetical protein A2Z16_09555 [Chloroflexi bacterium RBG_16_54_18]